MIPADYRNAWDIVRCRDPHLRHAFRQSASDAGSLPHVTIATTRIAALLAQISEAERELVEKLLFVGTWDLMSAILNFTDQILTALEKDGPQYEGVMAMLEAVPEQFAFLDIVACNDHANG